MSNCIKCGKKIGFLSAITEEINGENLYFCSKCHPKWEQEREKKKEEEEEAKEEKRVSKQISELKRNATPCPECKNKSFEVIRKGFDKGMAPLGGLLGGLVGFFAMGAANSGRFFLKCKSCGYEWEPISKKEKIRRLRKAAIMIVVAILIYALIRLFSD